MKKLLLFFLLAFFLRIFLAWQTGVSNTDLSCYYVPWGHDLQTQGIDKIYLTSGVDYPPVFLYILYPVSFVEKNFFPNKNINCWPLPGLQGLGKEIGLLYKLPLIFADLVFCWLAFLILKSFKLSRKTIDLSLTLLLFNPAMIYLSSIWGQTDVFLLLLLLLAVFLLVNYRSLLLANFLLFLGFFFKTQAVFFLPFFLLYFLFYHQKLKFLLTFFLGFLLALLFISPFLIRLPLTWLSEYYLARSNAWQVTSVWAAGLPGALFGNNQPDKQVFYLSCGLLILGFVLLFQFLKKHREKLVKGKYLYKILFITVFGFYFLSTRMHSRFLIYPCLLCFLVYFQKKIYIPVILSLIAFFQMLYHFDIQISQNFNVAYFKAVISPELIFQSLNFTLLFLAIIIGWDFLTDKD